MGLKSGMIAQLGLKAELTPGVPVVVDTFIPLVSESMGAEPEQIESEGILAGRRVLGSEQHTTGKVTVGGDVGFELYRKNLRAVLKAMFGVETGSSPYTYTPGDLEDDAVTVQIGKPGVGGTVHPFTYSGCKVASWELAVSAGEIATVGLTLAAQKEILHRQVTDGVTTDTSTALTSATAAFTDDDIGKPISGTGIQAGTTIASVTSATAVVLSLAATASGTGITVVIGMALAAASYPSGLIPVKFSHGTVTIAGSAVKVKKAKLAGDNGLDLERFFLGTPYRDDPLEADLRAYTAEFDLEFQDLTQYRRYLNGSEHAMVLTFTAGGFSLVITTNVFYTGKKPEVGGRGIVQQNLPMKCVGPTTDAGAITAVLTEAA